MDRVVKAIATFFGLPVNDHIKIEDGKKYHLDLIFTMEKGGAVIFSNVSLIEK